MHDATVLETRGIPTAAIVTAAFLSEAQAQLAALGMSAYVPVVIEHPLSTLPDEAIHTRALSAVPGVRQAIWGVDIGPSS